MIDLSIVIPHYNSVQSLEKLLLSIPNKKNVEIIVIDDKSDEELAKLDNLKLKYNHVCFLENNTGQKGAGVCRNIGLDHATGKWILFADADDFFVKDFYKIISEYFHSNYEVIFFKPTSIDIDTGNKSDRHIRYVEYIDNYLADETEVSELNLRYRFFVPWSKMIKLDFVKRNRIYFEEVIASNDVMFSTKIGYYMKDFKVVNKTIYCVTKGFGTLTTSMNQEIYESRLKEFIKFYTFLENALDHKQFKKLRLHGLGIILGAFQNKLGFSKILWIFRQLKKNNIKLLDRRLLNPLKVYTVIKRYIKKRHYLVNKQ